MKDFDSMKDYDLTKTFSAPNFDGLLKHLALRTVKEASEKPVIIPATIINEFGTVKYTESVSEITGTALPALYELVTTGNIKLKDKLYEMQLKRTKKRPSEEEEQFTLPMKVDELKRQNQSGLYKNSTISKTGNMEGAKYRIEGSISSIVKLTKNVKDVYYVFNLNLINNETGLLEWADEKEIRKTATR
jgi:hypothetical protein